MKASFKFLTVLVMISMALAACAQATPVAPQPAAQPAATQPAAQPRRTANDSCGSCSHYGSSYNRKNST